MSDFTEWESENLFKHELDVSHAVLTIMGVTIRPSEALKAAAYNVYQRELAKFRTKYFGE